MNEPTIGPGAIAKIRARIEALSRQHANFLPHHQDCVNERDWHGSWDGAICIAELECEIAGLEFALRALEEERGA